MVVKSRVQRVSPKFYDFHMMLKGELTKTYKRRISDTELTDNLADWMTRENIPQIFINRAKKKGGGRLF